MTSGFGTGLSERRFRKYMSKSQRPCDLCRRRKSACILNGQVPCQQCKVRNLDCTFNERAASKKSASTGLPPEESNSPTGISDDSTMLESNTAGDASMAENRQESSNNPTSQSFMELRHAEDDMLADFNGILSPYEFNLVDDPELDLPELDFNLDIYNSEISQSYPSFPALDETGRQQIQLVGLTGEMDPYIMQHYNFDDNHSVVFKRLTLRTVDGPLLPAQFVLPVEASRSDNSEERLRSRLEDIVPSFIGERLIHLFYDFVWTQLPVLTLEGRPDPQKSEHHLLAAIYLVTLDFAGFDDVLCVPTTYEKPRPEALRTLIWNAIEIGRNEPSLSLLQSALIILLAPPRVELNPEYSERSVLAGWVVAMAQILGLQLDPTRWNIPIDDIRLRKRLSWLVKISDSWTAVSTGRARMISLEDWLIKELSGDDFSADEQANLKTHLVLHYVELTILLDDILTDLFSLKAVQRLSHSISDSWTISEPLLKRVDNLSKHFEDQGLTRTSSEKADINPCGPLMLGCVALKALIFRAALRPLLNPDKELQSLLAPIPIPDTPGREIRSQAKSCGLDFMAMVSNLTNKDFHAFWPFWSVSCYALLCNLWLLLVTTSDTEDVAECKANMDKARRTVRLQARSFKALRSGLLRIDSLYWRGLTKTINFPENVKLFLNNQTNQ